MSTQTDTSSTTPSPAPVSAKKTEPEIVPIHGFIYHFMTFAFMQWFRVGGLKIYGRENVPPTGAVIIAPNHASLFDPPLVGCATPRQVTTMGKAELFEVKWFGKRIFPWIIQRMATFPVKRGAPDRRALRRAIKTLEDGGALVIFPEGTRTRTGELGEGEIGLAMIAHAAKAPIVPVYLDGTQNSLSPLRKGLRLFKARVYFGQPLRFDEEYAKKADRAALEGISAQVMQEIANLQQQAQQ